MRLQDPHPQKDCGGASLHLTWGRETPRSDTRLPGPCPPLGRADLPRAAKYRGIGHCPVRRLLYCISSEQPHGQDRNPSDCNGGSASSKAEGEGVQDLGAVSRGKRSPACRDAHQSLQEPRPSGPSELPGGRSAGRILLPILPSIGWSMLTLHRMTALPTRHVWAHGELVASLTPQVGLGFFWEP